MFFLYMCTLASASSPLSSAYARQTWGSRVRRLPVNRFWSREIVQRGKYTKGSDVWALGSMIYALMSLDNRGPFGQGNLSLTMEAIARAEEIIATAPAVLAYPFLAPFVRISVNGANELSNSVESLFQSEQIPPAQRLALQCTAAGFLAGISSTERDTSSSLKRQVDRLCGRSLGFDGA